MIYVEFWLFNEGLTLRICCVFLDTGYKAKDELVYDFGFFVNVKLRLAFGICGLRVMGYVFRYINA